MEDIERADWVELDESRFIQLEMSRRWPKWVVAWWVRQKRGEADFPVAHGEVERLPGENADLDEIWESLRQEALDQAAVALQGVEVPRRRSGFRAFLDRLMGRG